MFRCNFFQFTLGYLNVLIKNIWGKLKKNWASFKIVDLEARGGPPHGGKDTEKKIRLHTCRTPAAAAEGV